MERPSTSDQLKSILALPFMVMVIIPIIIHFATKETDYNPLLHIDFRYVIGVLFGLIGIPLFTKSVNLFIKIGKGTLAPWNPTKKLVVKSLYRYMRNPMITGVICILLAEAFIIPSTFILFWAVLFLLINHIYFTLKEEPDLLKRFGEEYAEYKQNVPRWIPRLRGWRPENEQK